MFSFKDIRMKGPYRGSELVSDIIDNLPIEGGVYIWRRSLRADPQAAVNGDYFLSWIAKALTVPYVRSRDLKLGTVQEHGCVTIRNDLVNIDLFEVGGGKLTENKKESIASIDTPSKRSALMVFLEDTLKNFGPVLYVGQADSLRSRLNSHISENSTLRKRLEEINLNFEDTTVSLFVMNGASESERINLEYILTLLLVSPLTMRAG
jgi:hypothetical protein